MSRSALTHARALSEGRRSYETRCQGELKHIGEVFFSDMKWDKHRCVRCGMFVYTVGGYPHAWNHDLPKQAGQEREAL